MTNATNDNGESVFGETATSDQNTVRADAEEIFELLKRRGPLCASQISVEILISLKRTISALVHLEGQQVVERRPDRDIDRRFSDPALAPWALVGLRRTRKIA